MALLSSVHAELWPLRQKIKRDRGRSIFQNPKSRFLQARTPPFSATRSAMRKWRPKRKFHPRSFATKFSRKPPPGLTTRAASANACLIPSRFRWSTA